MVVYSLPLSSRIVGAADVTAAAVRAKPNDLREDFILESWLLPSGASWEVDFLNRVYHKDYSTTRGTGEEEGYDTGHPPYLIVD